MILRVIPEQTPRTRVAKEMSELLDLMKNITQTNTELVPFDTNILNLLEAAKRVLCYISDNDRAYKQLLKVFIAAMETKYMAGVFLNVVSGNPTKET